MLVLASERATDGHDSLDCQMALTNLKQVTAFRKYHLTKEITIMRKQLKESISLTVTLLVQLPVLYILKLFAGTHPLVSGVCVCVCVCVSEHHIQ